tara:strand:- start:954 stop:3134 length:2181 start_codon:yes stop_codon:yes gene_type:complete
MPLSKLRFKPGINRDRTDLAQMGGWYDGNLIRFREGYPEKLGGWQAETFDRYVGEATKLFVYSTADGAELAGLATTKKVYVRGGTTLYDITPIRATFVSTATDNCFTTNTTAGTEGQVLVTIVGHGATTGDFVTFTGAVAVGGITAVQLNLEFEVTVLSADTFTIQTAGTATSATTGGGTGITAAFQINIGADSSVAGYGWGAGTWGRGGWSSGATTPAIVTVRLIFIDNFNNDLIFNLNNEGQIFFWEYDAAFSNRAVLLSSIAGAIAVPQKTEKTLFAPSGHLLCLGASEFSLVSTAGKTISSITSTSTTATVTTGTAHGLSTGDYVVLSGQTTTAYSGEYQITVTSTTTFTYTLVSATTSPASVVGTYAVQDYSGGAFNPMLIRWADVNADVGPKPEVWKPQLANTAGFLFVKEGSKIVTGANVRQETLVWTDTSLSTIQFLGTAEVFSLQLLSSDTNIMGPNAFASVNNNMYWMGTDNFFVYDGRVNVLKCPLLRYVFNDINREQAQLVYGGTNKEFNEVIWFYCSGGAAPSTTIDRYVIYNYRDDVWYYGQLNRTTWVDAGINTFPLATSGGYIYSHENGPNDGQPLGAAPLAINSFIESAFMDIAEGEFYMLTKRVIPDVDFATSETVDPVTGATLTPAVDMSVAVTKFPGAATSTTDVAGTTLTRGVTTSTATIDQYTNQVFIRARGRQMNFKISSNTVGTQWQLGDARVDAQPDGLRG